MKRYKWIEYKENPNNIVYALHDNESGKNVASIQENNYCDYTFGTVNNAPMAVSRVHASLEEVKTMVLNVKGIAPDDVE